MENEVWRSPLVADTIPVGRTDNNVPREGKILQGRTHFASQKQRQALRQIGEINDEKRRRSAHLGENPREAFGTVGEGLDWATSRCVEECTLQLEEKEDRLYVSIPRIKITVVPAQKEESTRELHEAQEQLFADLVAKKREDLQTQVDVLVKEHTRGMVVKRGSVQITDPEIIPVLEQDHGKKVLKNLVTGWCCYFGVEINGYTIEWQE